MPANNGSMETDELDQAELQLCMQALESSCLLPFLDQQLSQASFSDMASRQAPAILCTDSLPGTCSSVAAQDAHAVAVLSWLHLAAVGLAHVLSYGNVALQRNLLLKRHAARELLPSQSCPD